ncbi:hypothetical protein MPL1032_220145 [Mesorhizobium plurifarium]|uniref:Uncharacterized protein n=1 Tax=Mesorhizobium plurifarium TaxID=69974 RepID=A0A0K2VZ57_MESPL|nr:hypothetical protein MPL1032_220145 [Mesorhizobium plurifarium]
MLAATVELLNSADIRFDLNVFTLDCIKRAAMRLGGAPPNRSYVSHEILWRSRPGASRGLPNLASSAT